LSGNGTSGEHQGVLGPSRAVTGRRFGDETQFYVIRQEPKLGRQVGE
jgi:hypothetical protein